MSSTLTDKKLRQAMKDAVKTALKDQNDSHEEAMQQLVEDRSKTGYWWIISTSQNKLSLKSRV